MKGYTNINADDFCCIGASPEYYHNRKLLLNKWSALIWNTTNYLVMKKLTSLSFALIVTSYMTFGQQISFGIKPGFIILEGK